MENGVWRTVGGRRIFIKDGEDLASAMKRSGKFTKKDARKDMQKEAMEAYDEGDITKKELVLKYFDGDEVKADEALRNRDDGVLAKTAVEAEKNKDISFQELKNKYYEGDEKRAYEATRDEYRKTSREEGENLAKESGKSILINEYNKTDSRGSMDDDSFTEKARKQGMSDEDIAKEIYKKHNGPEANNSTDDNIKRLLAKQKKEESLAKGDKDTASRFEKYEKEFESRTKTEAKNYMQDQFKAFDKGDISGADLEKAKRDSGLSKQEIEEARNYVNNRAPESYPRQTENKTGKTTSQAVPKTSKTNDWVRNAFNDYKKEHPNTKMTLEQFKKSKK